ncbi:hypothetical protein GGI23_003840 [Coemansia sp. RSA 2559]|nr:hypothetical protein GGI23_003840 [Coemansia sp. RSA 2559]KAJ2859363.1 hypothetical protein GGI22_003011 [Coemansia erecta]
MAEYSTFRKTTWDPVIILSQIATVQCFGYSAFSVSMAILSLFSSVPLSPRLLFDARMARSDTVEGWAVSLALVSMGLANIAPLVYMVERSRLCFDFAVTFSAVHVILVWWHMRAPPTALLWWLCVGASGFLMAVGGRAACLRREMLPIAIRSLMPNHPAERQQGGAAVEEHELASLEGGGVAPGANRRSIDVLFDGDSPDEASAAMASAASAPARRGGHDSAAKPPTSDDDDGGWEIDSWDDDNDDRGGSAQRPPPPPPLAASPPTQAYSAPPSRTGTPLALRPKGGKDD